MPCHSIDKTHCLDVKVRAYHQVNFSIEIDFIKKDLR